MTPSGGTSELPDFLEVGLDAETRFRRLKEHYIAVKEDQDGWCIVSLGGGEDIQNISTQCI
jgi:hypothetical protein